jgi:phosphoribosylglycinamide formyltransferase-1
MQVLNPGFATRWQGRIVNIHPSLLPDFPDLHPQRQALKADKQFAGCTVPWVTSTVDAGPVIAQAVVPVLPDDTEDSLSARILKAEHPLYPLVIDRLANEFQRSVRSE